MALHSINVSWLIITMERKGKSLAQGQAEFKFRTCVPVPSPGAAPKLFNDADGTGRPLLLPSSPPQTSPSRKPSPGKEGQLWPTSDSSFSYEFYRFHILRLPKWSTTIARGPTSIEAICFVFQLLIVVLRKLLNHCVSVLRIILVPTFKSCWLIGMYKELRILPGK